MSAEDIAAAVLAGLNTDEEKSVGELSNEDAAKDKLYANPTTISSAKKAKAKAPNLAEKKPSPKKYNKTPKEEHKFPVTPRIVQIIKKPRTFVDHSYRDFSSVPSEIGHEEPTKIEDMTFAQKVHHILSQEEYSKWVSWTPHGRSFRIDVPVMFERGVCEKYFQHKRYSSFLRQLSTHGFKHLTKGSDRNSYYNEFFLRGLPHLCKYMPQPRDARRLIPDPENQPNFSAISQMWPVPMNDNPVPNSHDQAAQQISNLVGVPRLASEVSWMETAMPLAKRQALPTTFGTVPQRPAPPTLFGTVPQRPAPPTLFAMGQPWGSLGMQVSLADLALLNSNSNSNNNPALAAAALRAQLNVRAQMDQQTLSKNGSTASASMSIGDWLRSQR